MLGPEVHASVTFVGFTNDPHSLICRKEATRLVSPGTCARTSRRATTTSNSASGHGGVRSAAEHSTTPVTDALLDVNIALRDRRRPVPDAQWLFSPYLDAFDFYLGRCISTGCIWRLPDARFAGKWVMGILRANGDPGGGRRSRPTASSHAPVPRALIVPQGVLQKPLTLVFLLEPRHAPPTVAHRMKSTTRLG